MYGNNLEDDFFECETNGVISDSIVQNWTPSALDCYKIGCNCVDCPITRAKYSFKCKMKDVVEVLLKTCGAPGQDVLLAEDDIKKDIA